MNVGELLKEYRLRLGITQKKMATNILSPSYYSKVERNEHKISAEDLFEILAQYSINFSEFVEKIAQNELNHSYTYEQIGNKLASCYYQRELEELHRMSIEIQANEQLSPFERQLLLATNEVILYTITKEENYLTSVNIDFLKNKFFEAENWHSFKLSLYTNAMGVYNIHSNHAIISSLLSKEITDYPIKDQPTILYILVNFINQCLYNDSLLLAKHYNLMILNTPAMTDNVLQKIMARYYNYLFELIEEPSQANEKKALDFISVFKEINFGLYDTTLEILEDVKKIYLSNNE